MSHKDSEHFIQVPGGYRLGYELLQGRGNELPIVLVNGSLFNYRQWDTFIKAGLKPALRRKHPIIRYDYGGIGRSAKDDVRWDVYALADELKELLDALNLSKVHLYGISKGTIVGQVFAARYPGRVSTLSGYGWFHFEYSKMGDVSRYFSKRLPRFSRLATVAPKPIDWEEFDALWKQIYDLLLPQTRRQLSWWAKLMLHQALKRKVFRLLVPTPTRVMYDWFSYAVQMMPTAAESFGSYYPSLETIPVLIQHSRHDGTLPFSMAEELHQKLKHSKLIEYGRGYNHVSVVIRPDQAFRIAKDYAKFLNE